MVRTVIVIAFLTSGCVTDMHEFAVVDWPGYDYVADTNPRALTAFDDDLAGWGVWSVDARYGTIWTPSDGRFVPYATDGHFADLEGQLVWVSDVAWGRATLHHGRWLIVSGRWRWVPGMSYAPAWVHWSDDGGKMTWTPAPPKFIWQGNNAVRVTPPEEPVVGAFGEGEFGLGL